MMNIIIKSPEIEIFRTKGIISFADTFASRKQFFKALEPQIDKIIQTSFAEIITILPKYSIKNFKEYLIDNAVVISLNNFSINISDFKKVESKTCILQINNDMQTILNIFRENEIIPIEKEFFSQISRTIKLNQNNDIETIKTIAVLKTKTQDIIIQLQYRNNDFSIQEGIKINSYDNRKLTAFIHPIFIKRIIVNKHKYSYHNLFKEYFTSKYEIEKYFTEKEKIKCRNLRINYSPQCMPIQSLYIAQHCIDIEDLEKNQ